MTDPIVRIDGLTKHYGDYVGLHDLTLTVDAGEVLGFLGPNGAGKTTTIRCLLDLIRPTRGRATLFGLPPGDPSVRSRIGYLPGELALDERFTGQQMLDFLGRLRLGRPVDSARQDALCEHLRLTRSDRDRVIRDDSRGTKQKIGLVAAFQHDPELLILDEPTTGLDPLAREGFFSMLHDAEAAGRTVFHSSHVISEVDRTCSRVAILRGGVRVAVEEIATLRRTLVRRMVVEFASPVPREDLEIDGVRILEASDQRFELEVSGEPDPILKRLAMHTVQYLSFPEPDLDAVFRDHYAGTGEEAFR